MQSEEFDNKTREAAEHHHPAYDEKAWEKMEQLLNKHLPQRKDGRRRPAMILLFLLLLGGAGILLVAKPWRSNTSTASTGSKKPLTSPDVSSESKGRQENLNKNSSPVDLSKNVAAKETQRSISTPSSISIKSIPNKQSKAQNKLAGIAKEKVEVITNSKNQLHKVAIPNPENVSVTKKAQLVPETKPLINKIISAGNHPQKDVASVDPKVDQVTKHDGEVNDQKIEDKTVAAKLKKPNSKSKKQNSFFFTLSAGPELSSVDWESLDRVKVMVGFGVGYSFANRITVRTGIFSSRKIYSANPYDYHPPDYFWQYYPDLKGVDADCKVLEVPLSIAYNFGRTENHNWFGSVGMSSYFMKRETYDYRYKNSSGQLLTWESTMRNRTKHYFSVLALSGGYERKINKTITLMAEPFVRIPLIGVGFGKVKLSTAGVLFSATIHPFHSKNSIKSTVPTPR